MAKHFRINLLIKKERKIISEAVSFLNSYAKYVIVLTQIMVLIVFFVKIILDQTVIDLKETIDQKNQIILTAQEMISNNNLIAKKLREIDTILGTNDFRYQSIRTILNNVPVSVRITTVSLQNNKITISGSSQNPMDIQRLQIRLSNEIDGTVEITAISKDIDTYMFKLDVTNEQEG